jgi:hypothetical protein
MKSRVSKKSKERKAKRIANLERAELAFKKRAEKFILELQKKQQEEAVNNLRDKIVTEGFINDVKTELY